MVKGCSRRRIPNLWNKGTFDYRLVNNPKEVEFACAWNKLNPRGKRGVLTDLVSTSPREPTSDERRLSATVVQWLGCPVGQSFLRGLGYVKKDPS